MYLVTPTAVLLGWLLLDEVPPGLALVGGLLSLAGVYVARRGGSRARKSPIVSASPGSLSGPVALHAREAERDAARIPRRSLHAVERDLDDELRTNKDGDAV